MKSTDKYKSDFLLIWLLLISAFIVLFFTYDEGPKKTSHFPLSTITYTENGSSSIHMAEMQIDEYNLILGDAKIITIYPKYGNILK